MSKDQSHGKYLEELFKITACPTCPEIKYNAVWDVPVEFSNCGLPISIKSTSSKDIHFGDAKVFWGLSTDFKLVVFQTKQETLEVKTITKIKEYIVTKEAHANLIYPISIDTLNELHKTLKNYPNE